MEKYIHEKFQQNLKNRKYFEKVKVVINRIEWVNGEDVAPENLYYNSILEKNENTLDTKAYNKRKTKEIIRVIVFYIT